MFVDNAVVKVKAGHGGNGIVSFRHEKYVERGGPDGGDGGAGGDVVLLASENQHTLATFRHQKELAAPAGSSGGKRKRRGKSAEDLIVKIPVGTTVIDRATGAVLGDVTADNQSLVVAAGGSGGFGNAHFTSSTRQAPRIAEKGEPGEERELSLELKMIADVGLVGLPNAGKSTLLSVVSNARPEIADYPFTTLQPNLGVVDIDDTKSLLLADIPGLIEGASQGKGLGDDFLRHVERTAVLLHLIDIYQEDIAGTYQVIQDELKSYKIDLSTKPQIVALTKAEGLDEDMVNDRMAELQAVVPPECKIHTISAQTKHGLKELLHDVYKITERERAAAALPAAETDDDDTPLITLPASTEAAWQVDTQGGRYVVSGVKIERFAKKTDFSSGPALRRLRDIMRKMGITHELIRRGAQTGDTIEIKDAGSIEL